MACTISVSDDPDDVWMLNNRDFGRFIEIICESHFEDAELCNECEMGALVHGISLDVVARKNADLAKRVRDAIREVAGAIVNGEHEEFDERSCELFAVLVEWLDRSS